MSLLKHFRNELFGFEIFTATVKYDREIFCDYISYVVHKNKTSETYRKISLS